MSLLASRPAEAYSVLAHEAMVDALWTPSIVPLLRQRYPSLSAEQIRAARAYAYGGSIIQDLGYYPFGSKLFTNVVHYVRSGDFVEALIRGAGDANEYAFALGALAHYASDNEGHPIGVNRSVPIVYPKVGARYGSDVLYVRSPARHIMVEFAFDVLQVGTGAYPATYADFIGFEVAKPLLERAFQETYGLPLKDLFLDLDLAIGTYRHAVGTMIPEITRLAWEDKQDEIRKRTPGVVREKFVYALSRADYERAYGTSYRKPGFFSRLLFALAKIVPKIGPFKPLAFKPLTPDAVKLMDGSFTAARDRYRDLLQSLRAGRVAVANTDLDTGKPPAAEPNPLAAETRADLAKKLAGRSHK
jgi:zinc dependent phospholipase C